MRPRAIFSEASGVLAVLLILICLVSTLTSCVTPSALPSPQAPPSPAASNPPSPSPLTLPSPAPIPEAPQSKEQILRHYTWNFADKEWALELTIPHALYNHYRDIPRPPTTNYSIYISHPLDDVYLSNLADNIASIARQEGFAGLETLEFTAAFVQSLPYTSDSVTTGYDEYPRYPVETLIDNGGDCEDTSILMASLLTSMEYEVILITFPDKHCAVGASLSENINGAYFEHKGEKYFYLETTGKGWGIGQIPDELKGVTAKIYDMTPTPILTHDWSATIRGNVAELAITVANLGSKSAEDVHILAGFDAGDSQLWNPNESETFNLPVDQSISITLILQAPKGKYTRLVIQIIDNAYAVDESFSEWFDT